MTKEQFINMMKDLSSKENEIDLQKLSALLLHENYIEQYIKKEKTLN